MEEAATSEPHLASTQDGGNCSRKRVNSLSMRKERSLMCKVVLMLKTETSLCTTSMVRLIRDGRSSMLMNTLMSQPRVNSTRSSDFTLKEISTLSPNFPQTDILILSTTGTWSSRLEMEESHRSGTSINNL
jgi:hypothetical protein